MSSAANAIISFLTLPRTTYSKEYQERAVHVSFGVLILLDVLFYVFYSATAIQCTFPNAARADASLVAQANMRNITTYLEIDYVNVRCAQEIKSRFWRYSVTGLLYLVLSVFAMQYSYFFTDSLQSVVLRISKMDDKPAAVQMRRFDSEIGGLVTHFSYYKVGFIVVLLVVMAYEAVVLFRDPTSDWLDSFVCRDTRGWLEALGFDFVTFACVSTLSFYMTFFRSTSLLCKLLLVVLLLMSLYQLAQYRRLQVWHTLHDRNGGSGDTQQHVQGTFSNILATIAKTRGDQSGMISAAGRALESQNMGSLEMAPARGTSLVNLGAGAGSGADASLHDGGASCDALPGEPAAKGDNWSSSWRAGGGAGARDSRAPSAHTADDTQQFWFRYAFSVALLSLHEQMYAAGAAGGDATFRAFARKLAELIGDRPLIRFQSKTLELACRSGVEALLFPRAASEQYAHRRKGHGALGPVPEGFKSAVREPTQSAHAAVLVPVSGGGGYGSSRRAFESDGGSGGAGGGSSAAGAAGAHHRRTGSWIEVASNIVRHASSQLSGWSDAGDDESSAPVHIVVPPGRSQIASGENSLGTVGDMRGADARFPPLRAGIKRPVLDPLVEAPRAVDATVAPLPETPMPGLEALLPVPVPLATPTPPPPEYFQRDESESSSIGESSAARGSQPPAWW